MNKKRVTLAFNLILFAYCILNIIVVILFEPNEPYKSYFDALWDKSTMLGIGILLFLVGILLSGGAQLLKVFWNRFIADVFKVRNISFQESIAVMLMSFIIFG